LNEFDTVEDEELDRIRREKLRKLLEERKSDTSPPSVIVLTDFNFKETVSRCESLSPYAR